MKTRWYNNRSYLLRHIYPQKKLHSNILLSDKFVGDLICWVHRYVRCVSASQGCKYSIPPSLPFLLHIRCTKYVAAAVSKVKERKKGQVADVAIAKDVGVGAGCCCCCYR